MVVKRRERKEVDPAKLEAFAGKADFATPKATVSSQAEPKREVKVDGDLPASMLITFRDDDTAALIAKISKIDERSKHFIALKALKIGLNQMAEELGI